MLGLPAIAEGSKKKRRGLLMVKELLVSSKYDDFVVPEAKRKKTSLEATALEFTQLLLKEFGPLIVEPGSMRRVRLGQAEDQGELCEDS